MSNQIQCKWVYWVILLIVLVYRLGWTVFVHLQMVDSVQQQRKGDGSGGWSVTGNERLSHVVDV